MQLLYADSHLSRSYYIREAGDILGVTPKLGDNRSAKHVLTFIFNQLCNFKRLNFQHARLLCTTEAQIG